MLFEIGQALKAGAEADFQVPSVDTPDDIVAGAFYEALLYPAHY